MAVQRSTFSQSDLRDIVKGDTGLRGNNLLTDLDINRWGIRAQRQIASETHWYRTSATSNIIASTKEYDLPTDAIAIEEAYHNNLPLTGPIPLDYLENSWPLWRQVSSGTPTLYYLRGSTSIGLHPTPGASITGGLVLYYTAYPANPVNDADFYYTPIVLEEAIEIFCKLRASLKDVSGEGGKRVEYYRQEWAIWERKMAEFVENVSEGELIVSGSSGAGYRGSWLWNPDQTIPAPP